MITWIYILFRFIIFKFGREYTFIALFNMNIYIYIYIYICYMGHDTATIKKMEIKKKL